MATTLGIFCINSDHEGVASISLAAMLAVRSILWRLEPNFLNASQTPGEWFPRVLSFLLIPNLLWQSVFSQSFKPETSVDIFQY